MDDAERRAAEIELAAELIVYKHEGDVKARAIKPLVKDITDAIREALKERDFQWWESLALVDNVAPTPEAVKDWLARLEQHNVQEAVRAERERNIAAAVEAVTDCCKAMGAGG